MSIGLELKFLKAEKAKRRKAWAIKQARLDKIERARKYSKEGIEDMKNFNKMMDDFLEFTRKPLCT